MREIAVLLPCRINEEHQGASRLRLTIESFLNQDLPNELYEIILIDDGSDVPVEELLNEWQIVADNLVVKRQPPTGMCTGYNVAAAAARAEVLFFAIDDNLAEKSLLRRHLRAHQAAGERLVIGRELYCWPTQLLRDVITGERNDIIGDDSAHTSLVEAMQIGEFTLSVADVRDDFNWIVKMSKRPPSYVDIEETIASGRFGRSSVGWLAMRFGNHSMPKRLFDELGGVDAGLDPTGWYADLEFGYRIQRHGIVPVLDTEAITVHLPHEKPYMVPEVGYRCLTEFYSVTGDVTVLMVPSFFAERMTIAQFERIVEGVKAVERKPVEVGIGG
ncbi:glycosyltransferase [Nocardia rhizosphaerae]|uniref:Glycosyltransferase n=1 Tax=Nocardia rhizosphaerae TaxID=1691571 RepID=A0ABV8LCL6_9NOCA